MIVVLVPAYNAERFIEGVVKRILKQKIDKVIIVDDGSTDHTGGIKNEEVNNCSSR